ncbi:MAG TPA: RnfABCDGE type electron transport complex subunit G [Candidatus Omnitrophica bacterium]|nr:RnfABCDGE type electron transport complex subunit G [Candidatus Omnitrophota bacterium]
MKNIHLQMFITLILVGIFSGGALAVMYRFTKEPIERNRERELKDAIFKVLPETENYKELFKVGSTTIYEGYTDKGESAGYAVVGEGSGFQGNISLIIGMDEDLKFLTGIEILESLETPGLGAKIADEPFKSQFKGLEVPRDVKIRCIRDIRDRKKTDIQAITGATISSEAVVRIVNELVKKVRENKILSGQS